MADKPTAAELLQQAKERGPMPQNSESNTTSSRINGVHQYTYNGSNTEIPEDKKKK